MDTDSKQALQQLQDVLGPEKVRLDAAAREAHAGDKWHATALPDAVALATSTGDVSATMKLAHAHGIPVTTRGAGIGYVGGCVPVEGGIALSVAGMDRILDVEPADGVIVTQPGVLTVDIDRAAARHGWYYPPDPASLKESSIGGNIATNAGGPRCLKYGVTRHYVLGLEVVLADGSILRTGGRVHKNKTGFDLVGLMTGSEGLLGVITEATLRIIPRPPAVAMLAATFPTFEHAAACVQGVLNGGHLPSALEITDAYTLRAARAYLGENALPDGDAHLLVETDGAQGAVRQEIAALREVLGGHGALHVEQADEAEACEAFWKRRREFSYALRATGLTKLNEDIVVPRSKLTHLVRFCEGMEKETGIPVACFGHAGDGNIHANLMVHGYDDPGTRDRADAALDRLFQWVMDNGGAITGEHGVGLAKMRWFPEAVGQCGLETHRALKQALDPKGILNPAKWWK